VLVGGIGAGGRSWRRWVGGTSSVVLGDHDQFPVEQWVCAVAEEVDLPRAAIRRLAQRAGREPDELLSEWRAKTAADRERFWANLAPDTDDELLRAIASLAIEKRAPLAVASALTNLGERVVPFIVRLVSLANWPSVLFISRHAEGFSAIAESAAKWAMRVPAVPLGVVVATAVWKQFQTSAPDSRSKALVREGEVIIPAVDATAVEQALGEGGNSASAVSALITSGADRVLLDAAAEAVRAQMPPPTTTVEEDRARSACEQFLFEFLESLPETAGRFELNAGLDFDFGPRRAEVDLLCRSPRIAIELDGYFHFLAPDGYRRDRTKDWELQRRGYVVLRFLAQDVIPNLETIRDRILAALAFNSIGAQP
jgi:hypothetical protein